MKFSCSFVAVIACGISWGFSTLAAEEQSPISPDKKWGYIGGDIPKLVKVATDETVIDFFEQLNPGIAPAGEDPEVVWAPDSKRFGFNYSPMHAHHMVFQSVAFYQLRGDRWVATDSPADETKGPQLAQFGKGHLPKDFDPRHCAPEWDIMKLRKWSDANTAIVYAPCYGRESGKLQAEFLFTLKFDDAGNWKIIKIHRMSKKHLEEK
jgi:hypothetical protein